MRSKLLLFLFITSINCFSQFSKTHYIPPVSNTLTYETLEQYIYISCPSLTPINYKIISIGGSFTTGTVSRDNPQEIFIGSGSNTQLLINGSDVNRVVNNKGYIIEAEDLVYVSIRLTAANNNHAGGIVSKGLAALGKEFRIGAFTNTGIGTTDERHYTFASILATENNTLVSFSDLQPGISLINNAAVGNNPASIILNTGESYVIAVQGPNNANKDGLIGGLIKSDKPIVVNCGSFGGTNGSDTLSSDLGFDQIVSSERTGKEYIFIRGNGTDAMEKPIIIAHEDNTEIFLNNNSPYTTLNAGQYIALNGSQFSTQRNLYVKTSKNVFAYQGIGGTNFERNQNMHFVPPLSCETPKIINNIPLINEVGSNGNFIGTVCIVTKTGATLNFIINGVSYTSANLPTYISRNGPNSVIGNVDYETYTFGNLTGNISVISSESVYLSYYGSSGAATYGGFYSGFTLKPELGFNKANLLVENCIPNVKLAISTLTSFDSFEWFFNEVLIPGASLNGYTPTQPGFYHVRAKISACPTGIPLESVRVPVSSCPTNLDNDLANDNIDIDFDNDGITNCTESFGNQIINTATTNGSIPKTTTNYSTSVTSSLPSAANPFLGNTDGSFVTEVPIGKNKNVVYNIAFSSPTNISLEYVTTANATDLINSNAEYVVNSDINKTITVLNPDNQLLIDTNYDGLYESGVTNYSSFEIRFKLNGIIPLAAGTGTFKFQSYQINNFKFTHKNISDTFNNKSTFKIIATCVPNDSDSDGIFDQFDDDSDNDGILDNIEAQGNSPVVISNADTNLNGLDNAFETGFVPFDTDNDGVPDYLDLDADNDGIYDSVETGIANTDADLIKNYRELDSDNDGCNDVIEAGFLDPNNDGFLGNIAPPTVNINGLVTSGLGYTTPNANYVTAAPIIITTQPQLPPTCELQNATVIALVDNGGNTYQWEVSTNNGLNWNNITNVPPYSNTTTNSLVISSVTNAMSGYQFRVKLDKIGNSCGLYSTILILAINPLPAIVNTTLVQCDTGTNPDGISIFNLDEANNSLTGNNSNFSTVFYPNSSSAQSNQNILNTNYTNTTNPQQIIAKVTNTTTGCYSFSTLTLNVNVIISQNYTIPSKCDNDGLEDGIIISDLTLSNITVTPTQTLTYYSTQNDALLEQNAILNPAQFTNLISYGIQTVYARIEEGNSCSGISIINYEIYRLPNIKITDEYIYCLNAIEPLKLNAGILAGLPTDYTYEWSTGENTYEIEVNAKGTYSVIVKNVNLCVKTRIIKVTESDIATITNINVEDLSQNNILIISATGASNQYLYSLDFIDGPYQESNTFENVAAGIHTVYVKDVNGCGISEKEANVLGAPKYFTPNGDGYHEYWNLKGLSASYKPKGLISVFDRFGKLLKQFSIEANGWDGTFNGAPMPADDYWFTVTFENGKSARGNFSLKR
ncbi:T9SS type B sorting domain-containing protein [Flavobacterium sp.]|uniref:T9SS type B sorting domain-containing protein n=1 Tax=Flavobacterium sp. TaxID=239 RepID=UPI003752CE11